MGRRTPNAAIFHAALGLAVLTKGPVGFLVPVLVICSYLAWEGRLRELARAFPWWGPLLSVAPGVAWIVAATALAPPGFADEAVELPDWSKRPSCCRRDARPRDSSISNL